MKARCKFILAEATEFANWQGAKKLVFEARYDEPLSKEDVAFCANTPQGKLETVITNPKVIEELKVGQHYYIDITPVE